MAKRRPGRPERPIDASEGPVAAFAAQLRELREDANSPTYASMSGRIDRTVSPSTLSAAARGHRLPSWNTVYGFVRACGGDEGDFVAAFVRAGGALPEAARAAMSGRLTTRPAESETPWTAPEPDNGRRRWPVRRAVTAVVVTTALTVIVNEAMSGSNDGLRSASDHAGPAQIRYTWHDAAGCGGNPVDLRPLGDHPGDGWHRGTEPGDSADPLCGPVAWWTDLSHHGQGSWEDTASWVFDIPASVNTCQFQTYISDIPQASGTAIYDLRAERTGSGSPIASFRIVQGLHRGQWVTDGPFTVRGRPIYVTLRDQSTVAGRVAAGTMRAYCR